MPTKKQQDMGSGDPRQQTGGMGSSGSGPDQERRGGEHGEKRPTNADHDQKVARNRKLMLNEEDETASKSKEHARQGDKLNSENADDDVLGQSAKRPGSDPDRERKSGDIVSGKEHSQFPSTQAGYDDRSESQRPPGEPDNNLSHLDKGQNDDLSNLDRDDMGPLK